MGTDDGLVGDWNRAKPARKVQPKDFIVAVNGARGRPCELLAAIKQSTSLHLSISRRGQPKGHQCRLTAEQDPLGALCEQGPREELAPPTGVGGALLACGGRGSRQEGPAGTLEVGGFSEDSSPSSAVPVHRRRDARAGSDSSPESSTCAVEAIQPFSGASSDSDSNP